MNRSKPQKSVAPAQKKGISEKEARKREEELEKQERMLAKKNNLDDYDRGDGFVVDSEEEEENGNWPMGDSSIAAGLQCC